MATAINNSFGAIVPAVNGTATPVIAVGSGAGSINAAAALTEAGSVVVNLGSAPAGAVTYTASGLAHEMSAGSMAPAPAASTSTTNKPAAKPVAAPVAAEPPMLGQGAQAARSEPAPVMAGSKGSDDNGMYDGSGAYTASNAVQAMHATAAGSAAASAAVGTVVSTQA